MSIVVRIVQEFDIRYEEEFLSLEKEFAKLEARRADYPKGRRLVPIACREPNNTLVWECEFDSLEAARRTLDFLGGDDEHEELFQKQRPFFRRVRTEFYQVQSY